MVRHSINVPYDVVLLPEWTMGMVIKIQCDIKKIYDPMICINFKLETISMKQSDQLLIHFLCFPIS